MSAPSKYFLTSEDPQGGYEVVDSREGRSVAWRSCLGDVVALAAHLNACYPVGSPAPAWDSVVHEVRMCRIVGEPEVLLHLLDPGDLGRMIPGSVGGPLDGGLWRPRAVLSDEEAI